MIELNSDNKYVAIVWFLLSAFMILMTSTVLIYSLILHMYLNIMPLFSIGTVMFAIILFLMGRQRLEKYRMSNEKFNSTIQRSALLMTFSFILILTIIAIT